LKIAAAGAVSLVRNHQDWSEMIKKRTHYFSGVQPSGNDRIGENYPKQSQRFNAVGQKLIAAIS